MRLSVLPRPLNRKKKVGDGRQDILLQRKTADPEFLERGGRMLAPWLESVLQATPPPTQGGGVACEARVESPLQLVPLFWVLNYVH